MTTDYDLFSMFDLLKAVKRNANFGTTPKQRSRANQNETARFEAGGGTVGTKRQGAMNVANPAKTQPIKVKPKIAKPKIVKPDTVDPNATTIDGKPKAKKIAAKKQPKVKKEPKPKARSLSRKERESSQIGVDPSGRLARAAYSGSVQGSKRSTGLADRRRRAAARKLSAGASDAATYQARKLQNQLGVAGVSKPKKVVEKPKKTRKKKITTGKEAIKTACPLIKTELNGAFNNLLDNFQQLYK
jgi:hypothetical protein